MLSASNVGKCDCIWVLFSKISKAFLLDNSGNGISITCRYNGINKTAVGLGLKNSWQLLAVLECSRYFKLS